MILDDDFFESDNLDLKEDENVIWNGSPRKYFSITLLEIFGPYDSLSAITGYQVIVLIATYLEGVEYLASKDYKLLIGTIFIGVLMLLLPDFYKHYKKLQTEYYVTEKRVLIKTTRFFKPRVNWIWKNDLSRITYQEFKNKAGILYLIPKQKSKVKTREFVAYRRRQYPTFELIENVIEVHKMINELYFREKRIED